MIFMGISPSSGMRDDSPVAFDAKPAMRSTWWSEYSHVEEEVQSMHLGRWCVSEILAYSTDILQKPFVFRHSQLLAVVYKLHCTQLTGKGDSLKRDVTI
jgi:hypothetical protein